MGKVQLVIEFDPSTGQVGMAGNTPERGVAYMLLGFAHEILMKQALQPNESRIVVPQIVPGNLKS